MKAAELLTRALLGRLKALTAGATEAALLSAARVLDGATTRA